MKLEELTALYSPLDIEYAQAMSGEYEDLSFRSDEITIIAGLKDGRISGFWRPVVAVGDERLQKLHIERLYDICQNIYYMDFLIDGKLSVISQFLLRHRHKARPYYTQIIDVTKDPTTLHSNLRKSYKSLINNRKEYIVSSGVISDLMDLHNHTKGQTRSFETWHIQKQMINKGEAFVIYDREIGSIFGGALFYINNNGIGYYASGTSVKQHPNHAIIWNAIIHTQGLKYMELGEQVFSGNEKLVNISKFKRGFGGETKTRLILEKEQ